MTNYQGNLSDFELRTDANSSGVVFVISLARTKIELGQSFEKKIKLKHIGFLCLRNHANTNLNFELHPMQPKRKKI